MLKTIGFIIFTCYTIIIAFGNETEFYIRLEGAMGLVS